MKKLEKFNAQIDLSHIPIEKWKSERMYSQGYRFVGKHSAIKVCEWCKKSVKDNGYCYKESFYGIKSHQCIQMTPVAFFCDFNCLHCWRSLNFELPPKNFKWDSPEEIVNGCIDQHIKYLKGFWGKSNLNKIKMKEVEHPKHFAISLSGEPTLYPFLPEMIDLIKKKGMTAFLVSNGAHPEMIEKLLSHQPTNLYITLHAPNKELFKKEVCPMIENGWKKLLESLSLLKKFSCNTVIRLTLSKMSNMKNPEQYAKIIDNANPKFVEVKAYMPVGGARIKMGYSAMPSIEEITEFANEISKHSNYKISNKKEDSRVILMEKEIN